MARVIDVIVRGRAGSTRKREFLGGELEMDSRVRVRHALTFQRPDRVARDLWIVSATEMFRVAELDALLERFALDFAYPTAVRAWNGQQPAGEDPSLVFRYGRSQRARGTPNLGTYIDEWGCPFVTGEPGVQGEVKDPPLADWSKLESYTAPWEVLEGANWDVVDRFCAATQKFVLTPTKCNPFERMQWLRGSEALFLDMGWGSAQVLKLLDILHEFFLKQIELWCGTDVDGIRIQDDWGSQQSLLISPALWREVYKPRYAEYCKMIHAAGKFVFMHSDGNITEIIPDLIGIGVDALNSQLFCMDIEELGRRFKGRMTFWGEIDRQHLLPFGQPEDARQAVRRVRQALDTGTGGVIAQCQFGKYDPRENIEAIFEAWLE